MEVSFDSLPFLFLESQRGVLLQWKAAAMQREREMALQRQVRLQHLREYVKWRVKEIEAKKSRSVHKLTPRDESDSGAGLEWERSTMCVKGGPSSPWAEASSGPTMGAEGTRETSFHHLKTGQIQSGLGAMEQQQLLTNEISDEDQTMDDLLPPAIQDPRSDTSHTSDLHQSSVYSYGHHRPPAPSFHVPSSPRRKLFTDSYSQLSTTSQPPAARDPYVRLTALAKGFLTRRLLQSDKIKHTINIIKDARSVLSSLEGSTSQLDNALRERVSTQLQVAMLTLHEIMFDSAIEDRMAYIAQTRVTHQGKKFREFEISAISVPSTSLLPPGKGRLSTATVKAMERREKQKGEAATKPVWKPPRLANKSKLGRQSNMDRQSKVDRQSNMDRQSKADRQSNMDRQSKADRPTNPDKQVASVRATGNKPTAPRGRSGREKASKTASASAQKNQKRTVTKLSSK